MLYGVLWLFYGFLWVLLNFCDFFYERLLNFGKFFMGFCVIASKNERERIFARQSIVFCEFINFLFFKYMNYLGYLGFMNFFGGLRVIASR